MSKFLIVVIIFLNLHLHAYPNKVVQETAILKLSNHEELNWKSISYYIGQREGVIEMIPVHQDIQDWSELIAVQYITTQQLNKPHCTVEDVVDLICHTTLSAYPKDSVQWHIIEKNQDSITYEWMIVDASHRAIEHEIARGFLSSTGMFHRVGFTKRHATMSEEERAEWIQLLRENTAVVSFKQAQSMQGISMIPHLHNFIGVGSAFINWEQKKHSSDEAGSFACFEPSSNACLPHFLEFMMVTHVPLNNLQTLCEMDQQFIKESMGRYITFHVVEATPHEIIYYYSYMKDYLRFTVVTRAVLTEYAYISLNYTQAAVKDISQEEIANCVRKLKTNQVYLPLKSFKTTR